MHVYEWGRKCCAFYLLNISLDRNTRQSIQNNAIWKDGRQTVTILNFYLHIIQIASFLPKITLHNSRVTWSATSGRMSSTDEIIKKWCFKNFKSGIFWYFENWIFCYTCLIGYFVAGSYVVFYFVIGYSVPDVLSLDILSGYQPLMRVLTLTSSSAIRYLSCVLFRFVVNVSAYCYSHVSVE